MTRIQIPSSDIPVLDEVDVVVLGGGPAGIAAAIAASRNGAKTMLLERYGFLGGAGTAAGASTFCGLYNTRDKGNQRLVHGIVDEIQDGLRKLGGLNEPNYVQDRIYSHSYDIAAYKCVADDLVLGAGVILRLHSIAVGAIGKDGRLEAIILQTKSGSMAVRGKVFIDCSGDADLAVWAGAQVRKGDDNGFVQAPSTLFRLAGVVDEVALESVKSLRRYMEEAKARGEFDLPRVTGVLRKQNHPGEWRANVTQVTRDGRPLDCADIEDLIYGEVTGRRQVMLYARFLREKVPGFEKAYVVDIPAEIAIRETRRVVGLHTLTADELIGSTEFEDGIGVNGWPVERHTSSSIEWRFPEGRGFYSIPYRSLVAKGLDNILFAGRCLSAEPDALAAARASGPCFVMGQGVGTAAALAVRDGVNVADVDIGGLRRQLRADNVFLG
jgi:hypothetical protein